MESSSVADISDLQLEVKYKRYRKILQNLVALHHPERKTEWSLLQDITENHFTNETDEEHERQERNQLEARISYAELEDVQLRYIPDNIRKLRNKRDHWEREYHLCSDPISDKNWKQYEKQLNKEITKHKTVIKNLDKEQKKGKVRFNLSRSLDPERVQCLVDYIEEKETNDKVLEAMMSAAVFSFDLEQYAYVRYAIYAKYGEYIIRPSRSRLQAKV